MVLSLAPSEAELDTAARDGAGPGEPQARLLRQLRGPISGRPPSDPELAGGLREWLADALAPLTSALTPDAPPLVVTRRMLATGGRAAARPTGPAGLSLVRAAIIGTLFRQRLAGPSREDPMTEALAGLAVDGHSAHIVTGLSALPLPERSRLAREVVDISDRIERQWTPVPGNWLPRTRERLSVQIGGRLVLTGVADLLLGRPSSRASVCVVSVRSADPRPVDRSVRRLLALLETIRSGAQPFRVASYYPTSGLLEMEEVTEELLTAAVGSLIERIAGLELERGSR